MLKIKYWLVLFATILLGMPVLAQSESVVYAVLFYSPTCPHCHHLIDNDLPPIEAEFGENLVVWQLDVSTVGGGNIAGAVYRHFNIPRSDWVVPMMVIGDEILIGGSEIPGRAPGIIRQGLQNGGIALPDIPELQSAFAELEIQMAESPGATMSEAGLVERLSADPANMIALVVFIALILSLIAVVYLGENNRFNTLPAPILPMISGIGIGGAILIAISLFARSTGDLLALSMSGGALLLLLIAGGALLTRRPFTWVLIPLLVAGLLDAGYLAYVEMTSSTATCGLIGNCNAVQQSDYAVLFGVLPIGVLGIFGYITMLWVVISYHRNQQPATLALLMLLGLFGTAFSAYLTFLEPFVIGATCAWCLLSAIIMLAALWIMAPYSWRFSVTQRSERDKRRPVRQN